MQAPRRGSRVGVGRPVERRGSALGLVVILILALELLAHGALLLARQERAAALAGVRLLQARAAAEGAASMALPSAPPDALGDVPMLGEISLGTRAMGPQEATVTSRRLAREVWLVEAEGRVPGVAWGWRSGGLFWILDPVARAVSLPHALAQREGNERVLLGAVESPPFRASGAPGWCDEWAPALDSLLAPATTPTGWMDAPRDGWPSLGRLDPDLLAGVMEEGVPGLGTPSPLEEEGRCAEDPWNWGDPREPGGACGARQVAWYVHGDLELRGGVGQGFLVVEGSLKITATRFHGLVLVGGDALVEGGAEVVGQVRAGGSVTVDRDARLLYGPCQVVRALHALSGRSRAPLPMAEAGTVEGA